MEHSIKFTLNWEKAIEAITWLAARKPGISHFYISKILFYADKDHLIRYGRPILGDAYIKMEHGPVPSGVRDLLTRNSFLPEDLLNAISDAVVPLDGRQPAVVKNREPITEVFSQTDLECLGRAFDQYAYMSFGQLRDLSHQERAWLDASINGEMDYGLMIDEDMPDRESFLEEIRETAAYAKL